MERLEQFPIPVYRAVLPCGLTVLTADTGSRFAYVNLHFNAGAFYDGGYCGTAHLLEHVLDRGDSADGIHPRFRHLQARGAYANAHTHYVFMAFETESFREDLAEMVDAMLKRAFLDEMPGAYVKNEQVTILQEIRDRAKSEKPGLALRKRWWSEHPELHRSIGGTSRGIRSLNVRVLRESRTRYHVPENAVLTVTGGVDHERVFEAALHAFGGVIRKPGAKLPDLNIRHSYGRWRISDEDQDTRVIVHFDYPSDEVEQNVFIFMMNVLLGYHDGLLLHRLRHRAELIYSALWGSNTMLSKMAKIECGVQSRHFDVVEEAIWEEIERLKTGQYSDELFEICRTRVLRAFAKRTDELMDSTAYQRWAEDLASCWDTNNYEYIDDEVVIRAITKEQVSDVARRYLVRERSGVTHIVRPR